MTFNIVITGIGGQGVVSAGTIISEAAITDGLRLRNSDATGLAQRGGGVYSQVKMGDEVASSIIYPGTADVVLGFEPLEASRWVHLLKPGGVAIINSEPVYPVTVKNGMLEYPEPDEQRKTFDDLKIQAYWLKASSLLENFRNKRVLNSLMIGIMVAKTQIPIKIETLKRVIKEKVPSKTITENLKAFDLGLRVGKQEKQPW